MLYVAGAAPLRRPPDPTGVNAARKKHRREQKFARAATTKAAQARRRTVQPRASRLVRARVEPRLAAQPLQQVEALLLQVNPADQAHRLQRHLLVLVLLEVETARSFVLPPVQRAGGAHAQKGERRNRLHIVRQFSALREAAAPSRSTNVRCYMACVRRGAGGGKEGGGPGGRGVGEGGGLCRRTSVRRTSSPLGCRERTCPDYYGGT